MLSSVKIYLIKLTFTSKYLLHKKISKRLFLFQHIMSASRSKELYLLFVSFGNYKDTKIIVFCQLRYLISTQHVVWNHLLYMECGYSEHKNKITKYTASSQVNLHTCWWMCVKLSLAERVKILSEANPQTTCSMNDAYIWNKMWFTYII